MLDPQCNASHGGFCERHLNLKLVCLQCSGAVVGLGALGFLATKVDPGFGAFINDAMAKVRASHFCDPLPRNLGVFIYDRNRSVTQMSPPRDCFDGVEHICRTPPAMQAMRRS